MTPYVGLKHKPGGRDKNGVDCWGLVYLVYRERFNITLPRLPGVAGHSIIRVAGVIREQMEEDWEEIPKPFDGCVVGMSQNAAIHHVGIAIFATGTKIVHTMEGFQVIAEPRQTLRWKGFKTIKFYRHRLWHTS